MPRCPHCGKEIVVQLRTELFNGAVKTERAGPSEPARDTSDLESLMNATIDAEDLNDYEMGFINGVKERYAKYGNRMQMSEKQMVVLRRIVNKRH